MFRRLLTATSLSPILNSHANVLYELGIRHALRRTTALPAALRRRQVFPSTPDDRYSSTKKETPARAFRSSSRRFSGTEDEIEKNATARTASLTRS